MNKRAFIFGAGTLAAAVTPMIVAAEAATKSNRNSVTWNVPEGVDKIRVRSWTPDGKPDLDRVLSVEPNQTFRIDVVK